MDRISFSMTILVFSPRLTSLKNMITEFIYLTSALYGRCRCHCDAPRTCGHVVCRAAHLWSRGTLLQVAVLSVWPAEAAAASTASFQTRLAPAV